MAKPNLRAQFMESGDPSVGISDAYYDFDLGQDIEFNDAAHREEVRGACEDLHQAIWGEASGCQFSDECGDCGQPMESEYVASETSPPVFLRYACNNARCIQRMEMPDA